jgi:acetyltransferase
VPAKKTTRKRSSLDRLFRPRAVAVIGASRREGSIGREVLRNLVDGGFAGKVFPVNPNTDVVHSIKCHPSLAAIPDPIDLAVIVVPKQLVAKAMRQCAQKGVGGVVVITAGFRETGEEGAAREEEVVKIARKHGMRVVGPNCMGIQNAEVATRLNASFSRTFPSPGPVAFLSQSGAMGEAILAQADRLNLGVTMFVSMGNRADVSANDLIEYWGSEDSVKCILSYLESFGNPRNFIPIARRVSREKALVAVKSGRSKAGSLAASSHTGAMAGADVAADALLKDCGVQRVGTIEEAFDVALALSRLPLPKGDRVAVLTNAGGPAILATDALIAAGLEMAPLTKATRTALRKRLVDEASVRNPVDMVAGATAKNYAESLATLLKDNTVDMVVTIFVPPVTHDPVAVANEVFAAARNSSKPVVGCFMSRDEVLNDIAEAAREEWVPIYLYPESAVRALTALATRRRILERPTGKVKRFRTAKVKLKPGWLGVKDRRKLLKAYGIPAVKGSLCTTAEQAVAAAEQYGYPVVMKMSVPDQPHKSDVGGVLLGIDSEMAVRGAFSRLMTKDAEGVNVQKMLKGGKEIVIGVANDPAFGPILMFGLGGIYVEVLKDVSFAVCPVSDVRAKEIIRDIRGYPILKGVRGQAGVAEDKLVEMIQRVSQLACDHPEIAELEINPFLAFPDGIMAVDMRARVE